MTFMECNTAEAGIGMKYYLTDVPGTGGKLKSYSKDFIVKEISKHPEDVDDGKFTIAEVTTDNWETNRLVRMLSRGMGISRERIGFAGTKDKRAITTQLMSFEGSPEMLDKITLKDVTIENAYRSRRGIQIGDLIGNEFEITVRDCVADDRIERIKDTILKTKGFPNYFGVQRFGTARPVTHLVGEHIVRGDLEKAVMAYISFPSVFEAEETQIARKLALEDLSEALKAMPKTMSFERMMTEHLIKRPDDFKGAISTLPTNLQMMFTHAYQSYLFNMMLSERMSLGLPINDPIEGDVAIPVNADGIPMHERPVVTTAKNIDLVAKQVRTGKAFITIPLFGSETQLSDGEMGKIERAVIGKENIKNDDFIVPGLPHCSSKGNRRETLCPMSDIQYTMGEGEYTMRFSLPKGNYATCLMREFMKSDMERY
jgi:tRNA pseudouridine synthase, TruD family